MIFIKSNLFPQGLLRSADEDEVIDAGNIWDNLPLVEKQIDAIDFTRLKAAVKINKFPAFIDLNRYIVNCPVEIPLLFIPNTLLK